MRGRAEGCWGPARGGLRAEGAVRGAEAARSPARERGCVRAAAGPADLRARGCAEGAVQGRGCTQGLRMGLCGGVREGCGGGAACRRLRAGGCAGASANPELQLPSLQVPGAQSCRGGTAVRLCGTPVTRPLGLRGDV